MVTSLKSHVYKVFIGILLTTAVTGTNAVEFDLYNRNSLDRVYPDTELDPIDIIDPAGTPGLSGVLSPGEYEPITAVLKSGANAGQLDVRVSDLVSGSNTLPSSAVDVAMVHNHKSMPEYGGGQANIMLVAGKMGLFFSGPFIHFFTSTDLGGWRSVKYMPAPERWSHITAVYNGSEMILYADGGNTVCPNSIDDCTEPQMGVITPTSTTLDMGARIDSTRGYYSGLLDEVSISSYPKSAVEIEAGYSDCVTNGNCAASGDVAVWNFDEGTGSSVTDSSSNAFNGTIVGQFNESQWVAGKSGSAIEFNGVDNAIQFGATGTDLGLTDAFTIEFWIRPTIGITTPRVVMPLQIYQNEFGGTVNANTNNWLWLTAHAPADAIPGNYSGSVEVELDGTVKTYPLTLDVLPVELQKAVVPTPSVYYIVMDEIETILDGVTLKNSDLTNMTPAEVGDVNGNGNIDPDEKAWWFIEQQLKDIRDHGFNVSPRVSHGIGGTAPAYLFNPVFNDPVWTFDFTNMERFVGLMQSYELDFGNYTYWDIFQDMAGTPIPFPNLTPEFQTAFTSGVDQLDTQWRNRGWGALAGDVWDEPISRGNIAEANEMLEIVREKGLPGITHIGDAKMADGQTFATQLYPNLDVGQVNINAANTAFLSEIVDNGVEPRVYNSAKWWLLEDVKEVKDSVTGKYSISKGVSDGLDRLTFGWYLEKLNQLYGVSSNTQFVYGYLPRMRWGEQQPGVTHPRFPMMDIWNSSYVPNYGSASMVTPFGPMPIVNWEWMREGVDDLRYIITLKSLIATAANSGDPDQVNLASSAQSVLDGILASVQNKLADADSNIDPIDFERMRSSMYNDDPTDDGFWSESEFDNNRKIIANEIMRLTDDDLDGLSNYQEFVELGTNARNSDTDSDGVNDGAEVTNGTKPLWADTDRDTKSDSVDSSPLDLFSPDSQGLNLAIDQDFQQSSAAYAETDTLYILAWSSFVGPAAGTHSYTITDSGGTILVSGDLNVDNGDGSYQTQVPLTGLSGDVLVNIRLRQRKNKYEPSLPITINGDGDAAPTVSITAPTSGTYSSGVPVDFAGSANDVVDANLTSSLIWTANGVPLDTSNGTPGSFSALLVDGTYTIVASVTDSAVNTTTSTVTITVGSVVCSTYTDKPSCNDELACKWSNKEKMCIAN